MAAITNHNNEDLKIEKIVTILRQLMAKGSKKQYALFFQTYHEADIADALEELPLEEQYKFFLNVKPEVAVEILEQMGLGNQLNIISDFKTELAAKYIEEMEPDDAADLLEELLEEDQEKAKNIIAALPKKEAEDIKELLSYPEDSAGALMTSEFLSIPENLTVSEALLYIKKQDPPNSQTSFFIFIIDSEEKLKGYTTLRNIIMSPVNTKIADIRKEYSIHVGTTMDQEEVARIFQKYDYTVLPVVDELDVLCGIITVDDIVDVFVEEATEDIYKLSGTADIEEEKLLSGKFIYSLQSRLPWLILTIFGGFVSSVIINKYSAIYTEFFHAPVFPIALSLSFLPLLMGLGGNVGNQSATIFVRGISTGVIKDKNSLKIISRELIIGSLIGLIVGLTVFALSYFSAPSIIFSCIVGFAMFLNITAASLIGAALPIFFKKIKIDPAVASAPFISTTLDLLGQIIYFLLTIGILCFFF